MVKKHAITFNRKRFHYSGDLGSNLHVFPLNSDGEETGTMVRIDADTISYIRHLIKEHGNIKMGACRDNPSQNSLGSYLIQSKKSPQILSYILPLLEKEGYLTHSKVGRSIYIQKQNCTTIEA